MALTLVAVTASPAAADYSATPRVSGSANGAVFAIAVAGDRTYIAGKFTKVRDPATGKLVGRTSVAAFFTDSGLLDHSFEVSVDGAVRALATSADGSTVYIGGSFTTVDGVSRSNLAAVDRTGQVIGGWDAPADRMVRDLVRDGDSLFVAGTFGKVTGISRPGLAKLSATTGALAAWKVIVGGGKPRSISISEDGSSLLVGGSFATLGGLPRPFLGSVDLNSASVTDWAPPAACDTCDVFDVVADPTGVYGAVGGGGGRATKWSPTTGAILWSVHADGNAQALALGADGALYVGGHFGPTFAGQPRSQLAAVNAGTGRLLPFAPDMGTHYYPGIWALDAGPDYLRVGGGFLTVDGQSQPHYTEFPVS